MQGVLDPKSRHINSVVVFQFMLQFLFLCFVSDVACFIFYTFDVFHIMFHFGYLMWCVSASFENSPLCKIPNSSSCLEGQLVPEILAVVKIGEAHLYMFLHNAKVLRVVKILVGSKRYLYWAPHEIRNGWVAWMKMRQWQNDTMTMTMGVPVLSSTGHQERLRCKTGWQLVSSHCSHNDKRHQPH